MERMLVIVFDDEAKAYEGTAALRQLDREGSITVYGQAVVAKGPDGTATVKHYDVAGPLGTLTGTSVGSLIGLLGGPVGVAVGALSGMTVGALIDLDDARIGQDFVDEALRLLTPNKVAVVAEIDEDWTAPIDTRMEELGGTVLRRPLFEVRAKLRDEQVAAMKADLEQLKREKAQAHAERRANLQRRITQLHARIETEQRKAEERWSAFQARQATRRELFGKKAAAAGRAIKELAKTPPV